MIEGVDNWWIDFFFLGICGLVINEFNDGIYWKDWYLLFLINKFYLGDFFN